MRAMTAALAKAFGVEFFTPTRQVRADTPVPPPPPPNPPKPPA